jgi:hypothetical protein
MRTNCVNCGAGIGSEDVQCPFCGTRYFDFTMIDFTNPDPIVFKFKTKIGDKMVIASQLAYPTLNSVESLCNSEEIRGGIGNTCCYIQNISYNLKTNISFNAIKGKNGELMSVQYVE